MGFIQSPKGIYAMMHPFYCQPEYQHLPFPPEMTQAQRDETGAVICASSMMIEDLLNLCFPPEECFRFASGCGLSDCAGVNFPVFCGALAGRFCLQLTVMNDVKQGLKALCGDEARRLLLPLRRESPEDGKPSLRHTVLISGKEGDYFRMLDPMFRPGRSNRHVRRKRLHLAGDRTLVPGDVLAEEYAGQPLFLFSR